MVRRAALRGDPRTGNAYGVSGTAGSLRPHLYVAPAELAPAFGTQTDGTELHASDPSAPRAVPQFYPWEGKGRSPTTSAQRSSK